MRLFFSFALSIFSATAFAQALNPESFKPVNSYYDEQNPIASPDGKTLFFTVSNHPSNIGGKKDPGDIWFSRLIGSQWSAPIHGGSLLNDRAYNAVAGFSGNGEQLFLHGHYDPSGERARTQGIAISSNAGNGWSRPVNINIPYYQNKSGLLCGTVAQDGSVFVFSADTYGSHGVDDLYVCFNDHGKWTEPKNLGATINTQFQELSPSLSADGKTLFFSSNGLKGSGSFDVFSASRLDDSWTKWSPPKNLGPDVNSPGRELYYRQMSADVAIFTSTINSDGYGDIKFSKAQEPPIVTVATPELPVDTIQTDPIVKIPTPKVDTVMEFVEVPHTPSTELTASNTINVYGKVTNAKTGESIPATISFAGSAQPGLITESITTGYSIAIPSTQDYTVSIEAKGYVSTMEKLNVNTYEMKELEMNFSLQPLALGTTVNLKSVLFVQTKAEILPESYPELDLVIHFLQTNPNVKIELSGHTDGRGVHNDNVKLSLQRVNKVKEYLVSKGIESKRITGKGYGGTKPIASNDNEESRKMNRRVEFTIRKF
jgi:outer membrane protein OmpA-like peptidoglycan-associated protein